jgi:hypothetical protein
MEFLEEKLLFIKIDLRGLYKKRRKLIKINLIYKREIKYLKANMYRKKCFIVNKIKTIEIFYIKMSQNKLKIFELDESIKQIKAGRLPVIQELNELRDIENFEYFRKKYFGDICYERIRLYYDKEEKAAWAAFLPFKFRILFLFRENSV